MGGLAGRADALFGAVEAQKTTGSLHFHFFTFVQRLHQFASMKEIAELLEAKLVHAQDLKDFLANICCEQYADVHLHRREVASLEANFPTYSEKTECTNGFRWGAFKLGRLPRFLWEDVEKITEEIKFPAAQLDSHAVQSAALSPTSSPEEAHLDAARYKQRFAEAFQYFQSRCQHHIHKLVNGKRVVPNACRSRSKPTECKHEAPWTNRVSPVWMTQPLLVCKGLARKFKLRCSGTRNWLGQILGMRNDEWVNGTMPGLCVAFAGSNSDVKPNDRLPILEVTHEKCCRKNCWKVKKHTLKKTTRVTQRTQSTTNGYFGGYIGKRQPAGALETRKCIDKLFTLRAKMRGQGKAAQLRAASGRMITELEMNSTYRGAVEVFNLCRNLHPTDVLFAECIRTFDSHTIDGRSWLCRMETSQRDAGFKRACVQDYIPPTKKPNVKTDRARANEMDIYGYRPLCWPWKLLSPYEFLRDWRAEALLVPSYYENRGLPSRTEWTERGIQLLSAEDCHTCEKHSAQSSCVIDSFSVIDLSRHAYVLEIVLQAYRIWYRFLLLLGFC